MFKKTFDVDLFVKNLNLKTWFTKIGQVTLISTQNLKYINSLENAILIWNKNFENRNDEWENLRIKVLKNEIWGTEFNNIKSAISKDIKQNNNFIKFSRDFKLIIANINKLNGVHISNNLDTDLLISQLPIIGYFGEILLNNPNMKYYTTEVELFKKGHFVCEHVNKKFLIY